MCKSRLPDEQIIAILKEQEAGSPTAEVCAAGHGSQFSVLGKSKFGGLEVSEANG
jgi:putative transposase